MDRRDFLKGGLALGAMAAFDARAGLWGSKNYIEYFKPVCHTLDQLSAYGNSAPYKRNGFALAYFCTPYNFYPGKSCVTDILNIYESKTFAEMTSNSTIQTVLVFSAAQAGDPPHDFAKSYINPLRGGDFVGLTGEQNHVFETARNYRASFDINRKTGSIEGHSRAAILVSPKGDLIAKYMPEHLPNMQDDIARHIEEYKSRTIRPAQDCSLL